MPIAMSMKQRRYLNPSEIADIRRLYKGTKLRAGQIAALFNVATITVHRIGRDETHHNPQYARPAEPRRMRGMQHLQRKLTETQVIDFRERYWTGEASVPELAEETTVTRSVLWKMLHGQTWRHLPMPTGPDRRIDGRSRNRKP